MNSEQAKSFVRWVQATIGPFLMSHGYASSTSLEMAAGVFVSLAPLVWSFFVHTEKNAVAVVAEIAKDAASPVKAVILEPTNAGKELAANLPGTAVVAGTQAALAKAA